MGSFIYLSWCVLNGVSFILLLYHFFKCTSLINKKIGVIPALIFFIALPSLLSSYHNANQPKETKESNFITFNKPSNNIGSPYHNYYVIDDKQFARLFISLMYQKSINPQQYTPLSAGTNLSGLVAGVKWKQISLNITPLGNNSFQYHVSGQYEFSFIGIKIYNQSKRFEGEIVFD
ncbi:MAG TPA: hypothetical protein VK023_02205 [Sphingobacterium bovisgrunnientis]|jgi:hypothetical protein|nr:hypothetical protein [Sphingobacterium bovisgrunnientis]